MQKEIRYQGHTARPSDYDAPDGDLDLSLNLILEDGAVRPIHRPGEIMPPPDSGDSVVVFIHEVAGKKHYIIYNGSTHLLSWKNGENGAISPLGSIYGFEHCNAVGNVLIALTGNELHYYLWSDGSYTDLGNSLPHISLSFGLVGHPRLFSQEEGSTFDVEFDELEPRSSSGLRHDFSETNRQTVTRQIMSRLNKFIREQTVDVGRFCFPFFVRYALRLYDGSLVCHSAPVLMNPSTTPAPWVSFSAVSGPTPDTADKILDCDIMTVAADLDYGVVHDEEYQKLDKWKDIVKSIDVFISKPIYTYNQDGLITNITDTDNYRSVFIGRLLHKKVTADGDVEFPSVVTRDCMMGPVTTPDPLKLASHYMEWRFSRIRQLYFDRAYRKSSFHLPEIEEGKYRESLESCSSFYRLYSISLEDAKSESRLIIPIEKDYLQSLATREVMTDDYLSNDRLAASVSQVYNARVNLGGIRRQLFGGFSPLSMFAYCNGRITSFQAIESTVHISLDSAIDNLSVTVYVKECGETVALTSRSVNTAPWGSMKLSDGTWSQHSWGAYLFYPNTNAVKIVINSLYGSETQPSSFVADLRPHDFLNGAFVLLDYDSVRKHNYTTDSVPGTTVSPQSMLDCGNKVYTSEVNNPFYFPLLGVNTIGTGKLRGFSTAAKALSQGQFGQFPLYAFTTDGVWALQLNADGTYRAVQPVTRDVLLDGTSPLQLDSSVLFASARGIMHLSGSEAVCISDIISSDKPFNTDSLPAFQKLADLAGVSGCGSLSLSSFLPGCGMLYDYVHQRVIVYNPSFPYAYLFSLKSKAWGMITSDIASSVNSYPEALAVTSSGSLVDFSRDGQPAKGLFVTRPLKLDAPDILKTVDTVIQRGRFRKGHVQSVLYGSRDLFNWHLVWSSKDHCLRGFRGSPYKYFRIACVTSLAGGESISGASLQFTPRHTDRPR